MSNKFKAYTKNFFERNFSLNNILRRNESKEPIQGTTFLDLLLLPVLLVITILLVLEKAFRKS